MKLTSLLDAQRKRVEIDGTELYFKKLTWKELKDFQDFATKSEKKGEADSNIEICAYILKSYVTDEDGNPVIDPKDVERLPVEFCIQLANKFVDGIKVPEESEVKKK